MQVSASSFKAYDIRGVVGAGLDEAFAEHLGRAFGSEAIAAGELKRRSDTVLRFTGTAPLTLEDYFRAFPELLRAWHPA